jgi:hypothetical protein
LLRSGRARSAREAGMCVDDEKTLILPDQNVAQLIVNLREALLTTLLGDS